MNISRRFSKPELETFAAFYAEMGRTLEQSLSIMLRTEVMVNYRGVEQRKFQDFLARNSFVLAVTPSSVENRVFTADGEDSDGGNQDVWPPIYMNFSETVVSPVLDRLLGAEITDGVRRFESRVEMTALEEKLFGRVMDAVCRGLEDAWRPLFPVRFQGTHLEDVEFQEHFVMLNYSFSLFHVSGMTALAFPAACVQRLLDRHQELETARPKKLRRRKRVEKPCESEKNAEPAVTQAAKIPDPGLEIAEALRTSLVDVSVQMRGGTVGPRDLLDWHLGDVIHLNRNAETEFSVLVEGTEKFVAAPGKFGQRKVFRIL